jgi:hypothetical protein
MRGACLWLHDNVYGRKADKKHWAGEERGVVGTQESDFQFSTLFLAFLQAGSDCMNLAAKQAWLGGSSRA